MTNETAEQVEARKIMSRIFDASGFKQNLANAALDAECETLFQRIAAAPTLQEFLNLISLMQCLLQSAHGVASPFVIQLLKSRLEKIDTFQRRPPAPTTPGRKQ